MDGGGSRARGGLFGRVAAQPKAAFWTVLIAGLIVGFVIGAAAGSDAGQLDAANERQGADTRLHR